MFGTNTIKGRGNFDQTDDRLMITKMFVTLQGEGPLSGRPALFIRLTHCNLACTFCDTNFETGTDYSFMMVEFEIDKTIKKYFKGSVPQWARFARVNEDEIKRRQMVLVITGGEPTLQTKLSPFLDRMIYQFYQTQIESNGILFLTIPQETVLVISPKCAERDGKPTYYLKPNQKNLIRADCLKFVVTADDTQPYHKIPDWAFDWRDEHHLPIYISPMNTYVRKPVENEVASFWKEGLLNRDQNKANHEYAAQYCIQNGLYLSLQSHLMATIE